MPAADTTVAVIAVLNLVLAAALVLVLSLRGPAPGRLLGIALAGLAVLLMGGTLFDLSRQQPDAKVDPASAKLQKDIDAVRSDIDSTKKQLQDYIKRPPNDPRPEAKTPAPPRPELSIYSASLDPGGGRVSVTLQNLSSIAARIGGADIFFCPADQPRADQGNCVAAPPNDGCPRTFLCKNQGVLVPAGGRSRAYHATVLREVKLPFRIEIKLDCTDTAGNSCTLASEPSAQPQQTSETVLSFGPIGKAANASAGSGEPQRFRPKARGSRSGVRL